MNAAGSRRRVWVDLANSPQVLFFTPIIRFWESRGVEVLITSRPYAQTCELADQAGLLHEPMGQRGSNGLWGLGSGLLRRAFLLARWARGRSIDVAASHNSYSQIVAARLLGIPAITAMDFEHHLANHLAFRLSARVVVPEVFPAAALRRFGALAKTIRYPGVKEQMYLSRAPIAESFRRDHGLRPDAILAVLRPAAEGAAYHPMANPLIPQVLAYLGARKDVETVFMPRDAAQGAAARETLGDRVVVAPGVWDGPTLLAAADLVLSGGGTMVREAAVLGTPAYSLFAGAPLAVDAYLAGLGRLVFVRSMSDIAAIRLERKKTATMLQGGASLPAILAAAMLGEPISDQSATGN